MNQRFKKKIRKLIPQNVTGLNVPENGRKKKRRVAKSRKLLTVAVSVSWSDKQIKV